MVVPLLARRFVKYALKNIAPGTSKAQIRRVPDSVDKSQQKRQGSRGRGRRRENYENACCLSWFRGLDRGER